MKSSATLAFLLIFLSFFGGLNPSLAQGAFTGTIDPNGAFNPFAGGTGFVAPEVDEEVMEDTPFPPAGEERDPVNPGLPGEDNEEVTPPEVEEDTEEPAPVALPFAQDILILSESVQNLHTLLEPYELLWNQIIATKKSLLVSPGLGQTEAQKALLRYQTLVSLDLDFSSYDKIHENLEIQISSLKEKYTDLNEEQLRILDDQSQQLLTSIAGIPGRASLILNIAYQELENGFANFSPSAPMVYEELDQKDWRREFFEAGLLVVLRVGELIDKGLNFLATGDSHLTEPAISIIETARLKIDESKANQSANVLREWIECSLNSNNRELSYCSLPIH